MKFVESLSCPQESSVTLEDRQYQTPAILEDESGVNFLLLSEPEQGLPIRTWTEAMGDGIGYVAAERDGQWVFLTTERATAYRESKGQDRLVDLQGAIWSPLPDFDYREIVGAEIEAEEAAQGASGGTFVNLHNHSEYSLLDGFSKVKEMVEVARESGQTAISVTDHGHPAAHPEFYNRCTDAGIKPIMGIEANLVDDRHRRGRSWVAMVSEDGSHEYEVEPGSEAPKGYRLEKRSDSRQVRADYMHITLLAMTDEGLRNIWALASVGYREGFYDRPRVDWEVLERYSEGVIATTGCLRGPLAVPLLNGDESKARENLARLMDIYSDRLYVEIHVNQMDEQKAVNELALEFAGQYSLPYFASIDSHYARAEDKFAHSVWIATQTNKSLAEEGGDLFADNQDYHMASEAEVRQSLAYLGEDVVDQAVRTTVEVADRCNAKIVGATEMPTFSRPTDQHPDPVERDAERLIDLCLSNWDEIITPDVERGVYTLEQAEERFAMEMELIVSKGYPGYFLVVADYVKWAKENGCLVGPARGSGGASLVARLARIIEVDPIGGDLLFSRFINAGRNELPDFDIDFPTTWREPTKAYLRERWGADYTLSIGTISRLRIKGAIDSIMMALKGTSLPMPQWSEVAALKAADDASAQAAAGTKVSWDDFVTDHADMMEGMQNNYPEFMGLLESFVGRVKTFGKHPAGMVVSTTTVLSDLPVRTGDDGAIVSIFDMDALASLGLVKFDLLTLRTLDTIQGTLDMIRDSHGEEVDLYRFGQEYEDPQVWDEIGAGHTLGVFQVETKDGTRLARRHKPRSIADLTDVITIVRPGPSRSGLTDIYLDRRDGIKPVSSMHPLLDDVLGPTQGVPIFQEQVMAIAMLLAGYNETEADGIRKILGKKQVELVEGAGREFISRSVERGIDEEVVVDLWGQLTEFAKYCLPADSVISLASSNGSSDGAITVGELYRRLHSQLPAYANDGKSTGAVGRPKGTFVGPCVLCGNESTTGTYVRGYCQNRCWAWLNKFRTHNKGLHGLAWYADDRIRPARILDVVESGEQEVFRVTLANGRSIRATAGHRHLTGRGYVEVQNLVVGRDELATDGGYQMPTPEESRQRNRVGDGGHRIWRMWRESTPKVCAQCGETEGVIEQAHLNGDHQDQRPENYAWLCSGCHKRYDYVVNDRRRRWQKGHLTDWSTVVSVEPEGVEPTYDVVMDDPHNVVVDGVVTHNSFGKSHAWAYALVGYWTGWLKVHYPAYYLCSLLSTVDSNRFGEFISEARRLGLEVKGPDVNESGLYFTPSGTTIRYGLASVMGVGAETAEHIVANQPYTSVEDFRERAMSQTERGKSPVNMGHLKALAAVGAFDGVFPNRRALDKIIADESDGTAVRCVFRDDDAVGPNGLPCTFDWANEPNPPMVSKGRGENKVWSPKPPPKRCTISCRNYTPPEPIDPESLSPYTDAQVRSVEREMLGVWVSSSPFDEVDPEDLEKMHKASEVNEGPEDHEYICVAVLESVRERRDVNGNKYAFLTMDARDGSLDAICFASIYQDVSHVLKPGRLLFVALHKNHRGLQVAEVIPAPSTSEERE